MDSGRRRFLRQAVPVTLVMGSGCSAVLDTLTQGTPRRGQEPPRAPAPPNSPRTDFPPFPQPPGPPEPKPDPRALLKKNQETIKRDVKRLAELARQLESEMEKTDAAEVLSLQFVRTAEEIEKLAKNIKNLARG